MQALVVRASEHGIDLLAELPRVRGGYVLVESFLVLPDFDDGDVIAARDFRARFHSDEARDPCGYPQRIAAPISCPSAAFGGMISTCVTT